MTENLPMETAELQGAARRHDAGPLVSPVDFGKIFWHQIVGNLLCLITVLCALVVAAWTLFTGQVGRQGIDALFLIFTCLLIAFCFAFIPWQALRQGMPRKLLDGLRSKAAVRKGRAVQ